MVKLKIIIIVARVRRRGDRPPSRKNRNNLFLENRERQGILVSTSEKYGLGVAT